MNILITGSNGTIGCDLVELFSKKHKVYAFYRTPNFFSDKFRNNNVKWFKQDLKKEILYNLKPEIIIHCAVTHPFSKNNTYLDYINSNINALKNIIQYATKKDINKFFYLSSVIIYGKIQRKILNENDIFIEPDILGATKILSEKMLSLQKFKYFNLRLPGVLCYNNADIKRPWLNQIIYKLRKNQNINIFNSQNLFNNIIDTKEIFDFINFIIKKKTFNSGSFNFSASKPITVKKLIIYLKKKLSSKSKVYFKRKKTSNFIISSNKVSQFYKYDIDNTIIIVDRYISKLIKKNEN